MVFPRQMIIDWNSWILHKLLAIQSYPLIRFITKYHYFGLLNKFSFSETKYDKTFPYIQRLTYLPSTNHTVCRVPGSQFLLMIVGFCQHIKCL